MGPKFPHVRVQLLGQDGNAFTVLGTVKAAMKAGGCTKQDISSYLDDAMSGDYNHLLQVTMATVEVG